MARDNASRRRHMVQTQIIARGIRDDRVIRAMETVPRHRFVEKDLQEEAYDDHPLPIGHKQTISQPYIVALMTQALELTGIEKTLEIGTGSGYQTAILAECSREVYTVERVRPLLERAERTLSELGYTNILFKAFDGTLGWAEHAPFDAVMVTAGAPAVPKPLRDQLAEGGRIVIPVGNRYSQELVRITKAKQQHVETYLGGCRFVDLIGVHGWKD
ncbi:MAG: protein-L-isoaspartate(D-aspartate) O-methyltransferase [Desulfobacteraceae bacterium]|jgi:protein-L-isoaspartate(D-aspartate) O-methyltransferase